jgi:hypothetical protein
MDSVDLNQPEKHNPCWVLGVRPGLIWMGKKRAAFAPNTIVCGYLRDGLTFQVLHQLERCYSTTGRPHPCCAVLFLFQQVLGFKTRNVAGPGSFTNQSQIQIRPPIQPIAISFDPRSCLTFTFFFLDLFVRRIFPNSVQWQLDFGVFLPPGYPRQSSGVCPRFQLRFLPASAVGSLPILPCSPVV